MSLYTLSQLRDIQSLLLLFKAAYLVVKQQLYILPFTTLPLYHQDTCGSVKDILLFGFPICRF